MALSGDGSGSGEQMSGPRDLNGRPVSRTRWQRMTARLGRAGEEGLATDDPELVTIVGSLDDAVSSATLLSESAWEPEQQVVLRHLLMLPTTRVAEAVAVAGLDGYAAMDVSDTDRDWAATAPMFSGPAPAQSELVVLGRVQLIDAMHLSQERSRMASLGSRHGGVALGWQVWQRASSS
ncbi:hypothetical protein [Gordonia sp. NB41Y]|uniref:hypothetical protein n=1 Tax=Gordonia sp. NB41Y TaxID=875808 RepID=UPI000347B789|nr:hypothetical protein [Gordonia sp. NB41Y]WLP90366.1 hypothetical protein Q9K23_23115 [Gordonia sp. NB41Y]